MNAKREREGALDEWYNLFNMKGIGLIGNTFPFEKGLFVKVWLTLLQKTSLILTSDFLFLVELFLNVLS